MTWLKSDPPTIALTAPVAGSTETSAAEGIPRLRVDDGVNGGVGHLLELGVQGSVDLQPTLVDHVVAVLVGQLPADRVEEVLVVVLVLDPAPAEDEIRLHGLVVLLSVM